MSEKKMMDWTLPRRKINGWPTRKKIKSSVPGNVWGVFWVSKNGCPTHKATKDIGLKRTPWPKVHDLFQQRI